jgi:hypothetical protein
MRNSSSDCRFQAYPDSTELRVNSARQMRKKLLRPSCRVRKLLAVNATALATR